MANIKQITKDVLWLGADDQHLDLFENLYPLSNGMAYNSYLILDDKTVLMDTVDAAVADVFFDNLESALNGRQLDYVVVQHMEPDHSATLARLIEKHPESTIVCNAKTETMIHQFFGANLTITPQLVKEGDILAIGKHTLQFIMAPMVHWPEVMMTYDATDKILFSADAFGSFGALNGQLFADETDIKGDYLTEMRRYYANIVGKYGAPVQAVLNKVAALDVQIICPLHGLMWRENLMFVLDKYQHWSTYQPEERGVVVAYASIYGHTRAVADKVASKLNDKGVPVCVYDLCRTKPDTVLGEMFHLSHIVLAAVTHDGGLFEPMEQLLKTMIAHGMKGRKVGLIENGSWAPMAAKQMQTMLESMKDMQVVEPVISIKSSLMPGQEENLDQLVTVLLE